jgi:hypothetical protein
VLVAERVDELSLNKGNVLYKAEGCNLFANAVAEAIRQALREKP